MILRVRDARITVIPAPGPLNASRLRAWASELQIELGRSPRVPWTSRRPRGAGTFVPSPPQRGASMPSLARSLGTLVVLVSTGASAAAQRPSTTRAARTPSNLSLTPDGTTLAWVGPRDAREASGVNVTPLSGGSTRRITVPAGRGSERDLRWSP